MKVDKTVDGIDIELSPDEIRQISDGEEIEYCFPGLFERGSNDYVTVKPEQ